MKLFILIHKTALNIAIEKENIEIVKCLLNNSQLDINLFNTILKSIILITFQNQFI